MNLSQDVELGSVDGLAVGCQGCPRGRALFVPLEHVAFAPEVGKRAPGPERPARGPMRRRALVAERRVD